MNDGSGSGSSGRVSWNSPSNIALVKYWGKHGVQLPRNPSISFTLKRCISTTEVQFSEASSLSWEFTFNGKKNQKFEDRVGAYLSMITPNLPVLEGLHLSIRSSNSFPHSSGIASSASAFSALALCLCSIEHQINNTLTDDVAFRQKASTLARLGSGSASRSIYGGAALWGSVGDIGESSDEFAISAASLLAPIFRTYRDAILIVSQGSKPTSSSAGHELMNEHPFARERFSQAKQHLNQLLDALRKGDLEHFGVLVEVEAMQLHAMMMCSRPYYLLLAPNSIKIINLIREFRITTGLPICFTIDAGPNIHLLYPEAHQNEVHTFISDVLTPYCEMGAWIDDAVGEGPIQIE